MTQKIFTGWKDLLQALIDANNHLRYDGKVASGKTREERAKYLFKFFTDLWVLGFKISPCMSMLV